MIEEVARHWLAAMLGVSIQFTVLAAIVAAALFVSRPLAPRIRHAVWLLVLLDPPRRDLHASRGHAEPPTPGRWPSCCRVIS